MTMPVVICLVAGLLSCLVLILGTEACRRSVGFIVALILLAMIAGFRSGEKMPDFAMYQVLFTNMIIEPYVGAPEPTFWLISNLSHLLGAGDRGAFVIYALLGVGIKLSLIRNFSHHFLAGVLVYVSHYFILHEMIQIRAGVAAGILLLSVPEASKGWTPKFFGWILLASSFHYSSLVFLFLPALYFKGIRETGFFLIVLLLSYSLYLFRIDPITLMFAELVQGASLVKSAYTDPDRAVLVAINVFGFYILSRILVAAILIWSFEFSPAKCTVARVFLRYYIAGIGAYIAFARYPELAVRIAYTFWLAEIILIPYLIVVFRDNTRMRKFVPIGYAAITLFGSLISTHYFSYVEGLMV